MTDCIFCKIAQHDINANIVYENEHIIAFKDLFPQAPVHLLIIPKHHYATLNDVPPEQAPLLGALISTAQRLASEQGLAENGYRLVMNCNQHGGQSVYHLHLHLLGGRPMMWPPG